MMALWRFWLQRAEFTTPRFQKNYLKVKYKQYKNGAKESKCKNNKGIKPDPRQAIRNWV
ncbi:MAG: hypothetical protein ACRCU9_00770 [Iodobacter sp.]